MSPSAPLQERVLRNVFDLVSTKEMTQPCLIYLQCHLFGCAVVVAEACSPQPAQRAEDTLPPPG